MFPSFFFHPRYSSIIACSLLNIRVRISFFLSWLFFLQLTDKCVELKSREKKRKENTTRKTNDDKLSNSLSIFLFYLKWWHRHEQFHGIDVFLTIVNLWMIPRQLTVSSCFYSFVTQHIQWIILKRQNRSSVSVCETFAI